MALVCLGIVALTLAAYWPVRNNGFVEYDDQDYVFRNSIVRQGLTCASVSWAFKTGHAANWHPLTWISHMTDVELFGLNAGAHHMMSVAIHACSAVVLFLFLTAATRRALLSAATAAIFTLHPLRVESVAWASERKDLLCAFFFFLTLWTYTRYSEKRNCTRPVPCPVLSWYVLCLIFFALGLLSKPMAVTLPFVLLLLDFWPPRQWDVNKKAAKKIQRLFIEKIPFLILSFASCIITLNVQQAAKLHFQNLSLADRLGNAVVSYVRYLEKAFYPSDLSVMYPHPGAWPASVVTIAALLLVGMTVLALWRSRSAPWVAVGWFWFLGMLVPVIGFVQVGVQSIADRYTYLPLVGITVAVVWELDAVQERYKIPKGVLVGLFLATALACFSGVRRQLPLWRNTETLFTHALSVTRSNWVAYSNLGTEALRQYQALSNSGRAGGPEATALLSNAVFHCEMALQIQPDFPDVHTILSKAAIELGDLQKARKHLTIALRLSPAHAEAHQNLAEVCYREGRTAAAVTHYQLALKSQPDWEPVMNNLAWILATDPSESVRNGNEAVRLSERACHLTSFTNASLLNTLAASYAEIGDFRKAKETQTKALDLALKSGSGTEVEKCRQRLRGYEQEQPLRGE